MRSIAFKLTLAFLLVGLTGATLVAVITRQRIRTAFDQFILNREQAVLVESLEAYYAANDDWAGVRASLAAILQSPPLPFDGRRDLRRDWEHFAILDAGRRVIFSGRPEELGKQVPLADMKQAVPLEVDGEAVGWLLLRPASRVWIPDSPEGLFLRGVNISALAAALIASGLAFLLGGLLALTMTRTLRDLTEATLEIARGNLGMQVKVRSQDELGELATSFNKMSADLARATHARRQMTADIAHDLRSPLSVLGGYAEALSDGKLPGSPEVYAILHQETRHLSRLVDDLRTLSLADAGELPLLKQIIPPQVVLERLAARHAVAAQQAGVALRAEAGEGLPEINIDVERLSQAFDNLILNAFRHTPAGGEVVLSARALGAGVQFQVRDNGSGVSPEDLPYIFDRFYRGDKARSSTGVSGLGLAIARSIVAAHGGTIRAESQPGAGTTFTITLVS
ncbi:MAG: ATP-binding protein [Chloroflexi bacterium]|nr:ATP-binding protein [Chloroflexota bacterium]